MQFQQQEQSSNLSKDESEAINKFQTVFSQHFSHQSLASNLNKKGQQQILQEEMALLEAAEQVAEACHAVDKPKSISPNMPSQNSYGIYTPHLNAETLLKNLLEFNPIIYGCDPPAPIGGEYEPLISTGTFSPFASQTRLNEGKKTTIQNHVFKSALFSPVLRLDLQKKESLYSSDQRQPEPSEEVLSNRARQVSNKSTRTTTQAGVYSLNQPFKRISKFAQSSASEIYRKQILKASQSKVMFSKEHFFNKCASKEFALESDPTETWKTQREHTAKTITRKTSPNFARVMKH